MTVPRRCRSVLGTGDLVLREATGADHPDLTACLLDFDSMKALTGYDQTSEDEAADELDHRELPPGGSPDRDRLYLILFEGRCVGYAKWYEGAPTPETAFLGFFGIRPPFQHHGLASRAFALVEAELADRGYRRIRINVGTRNVPALRFWIHRGFLRIVGSSDAAPGFLDVNLEKEIGRAD